MFLDAVVDAGLVVGEPQTGPVGRLVPADGLLDGDPVFLRHPLHLRGEPAVGVDGAGVGGQVGQRNEAVRRHRVGQR